ncbi:MAG: hypothetical protein H6577_17330 [Lewinellaceae bacterium]|nr:hypothetical protein [Saprospiraceae bacterium]MCB9339890.1 hypothetical protein [Lewinellaceae bacterium]
MTLDRLINTLAAFLIIAFLPGSLSSLSAQNLRDTLFEEVKSQLEPLIASLQMDSPFSDADGYNVYVVDAVLNLKDQNLEPINKDRQYDLQIKQAERDWGLNIRTQFYHNFDQSYLLDDEIDAQQNPTRLRIGLEWDLLNEGFFGHQNKVRQLRNEKEMDWLEFDQRRNKERYFYRFNILIYYFNQQKIQILKERQNSLKIQLALLHRIYYLRDIFFDEIIAMKSDLEQIEVQLKNYLDYNAFMESSLGIDKFPDKIDVEKLPVVDLDIHRMLQDSSFHAATETIQRLMRENENLRNNPLNDISLRLQLHQNLGLAGPNGNTRVYTSAGFTASVPFEVLAGNKIDTELSAAKIAEQAQWQRYEDLNNSTDIINLYYEFNYKMKQYVEYLYKHILYEEKLRVEQVFREDFTDYYQPFQLLKYQDNLLAVHLELLDLKQQLYLYLLRIYAKTNLKSLRPYLYPLSIQQYLSRLPASRTIFVKARDFDRYDRQFIDNYLKFNDFNYAILQEPDLVDISPSAGIRHFASASRARLIKTINWDASTKDEEKAAIALANSLRKNDFGGFLIYINREDYQKRTGSPTAGDLVGRMEEFIHYANNLIPGLAVFISLPVDFPITELTGLGRLSEKIILRVEEKADIAYLQSLPKRILPFEQLPICLSLNVRQFSDRLKMEAFIQQVLLENRINDVVFNDLQAYIEMETKMFSQ